MQNHSFHRFMTSRRHRAASVHNFMRKISFDEADGYQEEKTDTVRVGTIPRIGEDEETEEQNGIKDVTSNKLVGSKFEIRITRKSQSCTNMHFDKALPE